MPAGPVGAPSFLVTRTRTRVRMLCGRAADTRRCGRWSTYRPLIGQRYEDGPLVHRNTMSIQRQRMAQLLAQGLSSERTAAISVREALSILVGCQDPSAFEWDRDVRSKHDV